jgi:predicted GH43/DUF377 family glycosyl hydrolase
VLSSGARHRANSKWLNAISVEADRDQIDRIAGLPFVRAIDRVLSFKREVFVNRPDGVFEGGRGRSLDYGPSYGQIHQIAVDPLHDLGYSANGVIVLMLDTGYNLDHESLDDIDLIDEWDFINDDSVTQNEAGDPPDQHNHGTYTLSALGGYHPGQLVGPAYGASFLLAKTEDTSMEEPIEEDWWVEGLEWGDSLGAQVVSSSLGYTDWYTYEWMNGDSCVTTIAADIAAQNGIVVCNCMGNEGWYPGALLAPADADSIIAVGAVDSNGDLANFSSTGPTYDGRIKPEVCAQGVNTYCASPYDSDEYFQVGGTSLSTPLIGGSAALLLEVHPEWTPMEVREAMITTASQAGEPDNYYGWGIANIFEASGLEAPYLEIISYGVDDGGGNGALTPGETAEISVTLQNNGYGVACDLLALIRTEDPEVTITDSISSFNNVGPGDTVNTITPFVVQIGGGHALDESIEFEIEIQDSVLTTWTRALQLPCTDREPWTKDQGNPVLEPGEEGEWDDYSVGGPSVIEDDGILKMWYSASGDDPDQGAPLHIGYATSEDGGATWTRDTANNPVLSPSASGWDDRIVYFPYVFLDSDTFKMWYVGSDTTMGGMGGTGIGYATSTDGVTWTKCSSNPVIEGDDYEWDWWIWYGLTVLKEGPSDYTLWYTGIGYPDFQFNIGMAISSNGVNWIRTGDPVIEPSGDEWSFDYEHTVCPAVVSDDGTYYLWYTGGGTDGRGRIGWATSSTGLTWTNRLGPGTFGADLDAGEWTDWDGHGALAGPILLHEGTLKMFYTGFIANAMQIGLATRDPWDIRETLAIPSNPHRIQLGPVRPNPFRSEIEIEYSIGLEGLVTLRVFDASGRLVRTLHDGILPSGTHRATWRGNDDLGRSLRSGIYFCELRSGSTTRTARILRLETGT